MPQPIFEVGPHLRLRLADKAALEAAGCSAHVGPTDEALPQYHALAPGAAFVQEPFDSAQLEAAVRDVFAAGRQHP